VTRRRYNGPQNQAVIFEFALVHCQHGCVMPARDRRSAPSRISSA